MPRMFDILRGKTDSRYTGSQKNKPAQTIFPGDGENIIGSGAKLLSFPKEILRADVAKNEGPESPSSISKKLISVVKKYGVDNQERTKGIYDNAVETVKVMLERLSAGEDPVSRIDKVHEIIDSIFNQLLLGDNILSHIYDEEENGYYLPYHIVNVLILSLAIGLNMGFNKSRLSYLGMASVFSDIGMVSLRGILNQPRRLNEEEHSLVRTHISRSLEVIEKIGSVNNIIKETVIMHHERINGKGYPRGIGEEVINPYARILGLVDTYEAMTHPRAYRESMSAHRAVRILVGSLKDEFDSDVIKSFINKMSIYPIGSIVRLDTDEIARVIGVQPGSPLRPVVMILRDVYGEPVKERIVIDLSRQDVPSIKDSI